MLKRRTTSRKVTIENRKVLRPLRMPKGTRNTRKKIRKPQKRALVKTEGCLEVSGDFGASGGGSDFSGEEERLLFMGKN